MVRSNLLLAALMLTPSTSLVEATLLQGESSEADFENPFQVQDFGEDDEEFQVDLEDSVDDDTESPDDTKSPMRKLGLGLLQTCSISVDPRTCWHYKKCGEDPETRQNKKGRTTRTTCICSKKACCLGWSFEKACSCQQDCRHEKGWKTEMYQFKKVSKEKNQNFKLGTIAAKKRGKNVQKICEQ